MLVVQRALIRIIIRRGKVFSFSNGFWMVCTAICYNIYDGICPLHQRYTAGKNSWKKLEIPRLD